MKLLFIKQKKHSAFTFAEVMISVVVAALFSLVFFNFYSQANKSQAKLVDGLQMQSSMVTGINKVLHEVRCGRKFIIPALQEKSSTLVFTDSRNNIVSIFPLKNDKLSEEEKEPVYDLWCYTSETATYSSGNHDPKNLRQLCSFLKDIKIQLSSAKSANITFTFIKNAKLFQVIAEAAVMNSSDLD